MRDSVAEFFAIARSSRFTAYAQGVSMRLPTGENITVKIERTSKSLRPAGMRFSTFAFMTEVSAGTFRGVGFGEGTDTTRRASKKHRRGCRTRALQILKGTLFGTQNSNGWAAHTNRARAIESAVDELVERDAILVHWLGKIPMTEVAPPTWPSWLTRWTQGELRLSPTFTQLRILASSRGYKPTITTVLLSDTGHAVLSHATAASIEQALQKALTETCRIAQIAKEGLTSNLQRPSRRTPMVARPSAPRTMRCFMHFMSLFHSGFLESVLIGRSHEHSGRPQIKNSESRLYQSSIQSFIRSPMAPL